METQVQLSKKEISRIHEFVQSKNVPYIDVEYEIVDHLASSVEELMSSDENIDFEQALENVYSDFPITGFAVYQLEIETAIRRYWKRSLLAYLKLYFKLPRIIFTIVLGLSLYNLFAHFGLIALFIISLILVIYTSIFLRHKREKLELLDSKVLIVKSFTYWMKNFTEILSTVVFFIWLDTWDYFKGEPSMFENIPIIMAIYFTFCFIAGFAYIHVFPKMLENDLNRKYAHLELT